ncbi:MAG: HNH endonuclease signature motif containing protein [Ilumatobacteraceae bacterium]
MTYELEPERPREGDAKWETGQIPPALRAEVLARDGGVCRFCGAVPESPAMHHVRYRSEGGLNVLENLITVHWMFAPRCHEKIHANKGRWQEIGLYVAKNPGLTMLQVERWQGRTGTSRR